MIRKLRTIGFLAGPIPFVATGLLGLFIKVQRNRIKKSTKITLQEKIELGITDDKLKIIIPNSLLNIYNIVNSLGK